MEEGRKLGYLIGITVATLLIVWCQAWFLTVVFSWFNLYLNIWQALGMVILMKSIVSMTSNK